MRKKITIMPLVFILMAGCSGLKAHKIVDIHQRYMEVSLAFNTESYPWLLGTKYPQLAVWVASDDGDPETVFVSQGAGKDKWMFADKRPGALPVWTGVRYGQQEIDIDAVSGATPSGEVHNIVWEIPEKYKGKNLTVFIEANVSFDYNDRYTKDETDPGYSDVNGQPSVVWKSSFTVDDTPKALTPEISGHGHVLGKNSVIDSDMSGITTAVELFKYLKVSYQPGN